MDTTSTGPPLSTAKRPGITAGRTRPNNEALTWRLSHQSSETATGPTLTKYSLLTNKIMPPYLLPTTELRTVNRHRLCI